MEPLLSICCITYNHVKYIEEAIKSFLLQKTTFPIEIIINDDASNDGTTAIIKKYEGQYPDLVFPVYHNENEYSKGLRGILVRNTFPRARGKYIALCEGDDYWTDPLKLQKQVDFLESHKEFSLVCHDAIKINEITNSSTSFFGPAKRKQVCSTKDTLNVHFCPTASIVVRKESILPFSSFDTTAAAGDHFLVQMASLKGLIYRMFDVMSVYRKTVTGASEVNRKNLAASLKNRMDTLNHLNRVSNYKYKKLIRIENLLIQNRIDLLNSTSKSKTGILKLKRKALSYIKRFL